MRPKRWFRFKKRAQQQQQLPPPIPIQCSTVNSESTCSDLNSNSSSEDFDIHMPLGGGGGIKKPSFTSRLRKLQLFSVLPFGQRLNRWLEGLGNKMKFGSMGMPLFADDSDSSDSLQVSRIAAMIERRRTQDTNDDFVPVAGMEVPSYASAERRDSGFGSLIDESAKSPSSSIKTVLTAEQLADEKQVEFIKSIFDQNAFLHPIFTFRYRPLYCSNRGSYGFSLVCCRDDQDMVLVKFVKKSNIPQHLWITSRVGDKLPIELTVYRANKNIRYPEYIEDYDHDGYYYIVTELHGLPRKKFAANDDNFNEDDGCEESCEQDCKSSGDEYRLAGYAGDYYPIDLAAHHYK